MELKYAPFSSTINPGFWTSFTKLKLEVLGLQENALDIEATYSNKDQKDLPAMMNIDWDAFESTSKDLSLTWSSYSATGNVINYNTMEAFKTFNKVQYLNETELKYLVENIKNDKNVFEDPRILCRFVIHMFADLKKYHYYYWFAFPAVVLPKEIVLVQQPTLFSEHFDQEKCQKLSKKYQEWKKINPKQSGFFWFNPSESKFILLKDGFDMENPHLSLGFADPSTLPEYPGWPLRNLLAFIALKSPQKLRRGLKILALRQKAVDSVLTIGSSLLLEIQWKGNEAFENLQITGWEKNDKGQFAPKFANMRSSMDPKSLAESSVDLNLKLMKWRLVPDLDLSKMYNVKCLLLGSGTLGCNVARCLLGNFRKFHSISREIQISMQS